MNWRDIPSLAALKGFEAAARAGSFSAAARELNVTHAAIAQHVRTVEAHLGMSLLNREGRKMVLTVAGAQLSNDLNAGFGTIIDGVTRIVEDANARPLSVTVTPNFAEYWLMPRLCGFWNRHPEITVTVTASNNLVDLRRDGYDIAIRYGDGNYPGLESEFLVAGDYVVVATPSLLGDRKACSIADLQDLTWLFSDNLPVYKRWAVENGLDLAACTIKEISSMSMITSAVRAGGGVSVVIRAMVEDDIATGRLIVIQEGAQAELGYYTVRQAGAETEKVKTFRKWLRTQV
jgi:LysR family glycine cleavage system transcriptional activator